MDFLPPAFAALKNFPQFVLYKLIPKGVKFDKVPVNLFTGENINAHDPKNWAPADSVIVAAKAFGTNHGVGFVFTENDPFWFLDIDSCLDATNNWSPLAAQLMTFLSGCAIEISSSQKGLHIIGTGKIDSHACKNTELGLEFYTQKRFVALTGMQALGDVSFNAQHLLPQLIETYFKPKSANSGMSEWTDAPVSEWKGPEDDIELIDKMLKAKSAKNLFNFGASFHDLWHANVDALQKAYPDTTGKNRLYDESSADAALVQHLAFWTGNNCERMLRLMPQSKLKREKWDRNGYLRLTIQTACSRQTQFYKMPEPKTPAALGSNTFANLDDQLRLFKGCVYILDSHEILIPGGYTLNPERFRVAFGGYSFPVDPFNQKITRNAWEAFTESQLYKFPFAHGSTFKPDLEPGAIIEKDGQKLVNLWTPIDTRRVKGDPSRMLQHIAKLFPDERDQKIIISYMAAIVRYPGIKFQWCPVIQGVEGNGKTLLSRCVAFAVGDRYTAIPRQDKLGGRFNDWMYRKIFVAVEDIFIFGSQSEVYELLKPMITSPRQEVEGKGKSVITVDVCCNFIMNSNHKEGLAKSRNNRTFAPLYTAQQHVSDLKRDGLTEDYFFSLIKYMYKDDGFAIFSNYLHEYDIPDEFNPATECVRAPITSSTEAAIKSGVNAIEQEILEAICQGQVGFKGGWVSSMSLDRLLKDIGANRKIPPNRRRELLHTLGYEWHPALKDGRTTVMSLIDCGKPRLYLSKDHVAIHLTDPLEIIKTYQDAQR